MALIEEKIRRIIHVDMDAFYAAIEVRDNPGLAGKPLIMGALPGERGVVCTASYEARKYGVRSAMSIAEAYRRCPHGIYMEPNMEKIVEASKAIHKIWREYTDIYEYISLDEGFLDITDTEHLFGGPRSIGHKIKLDTKEKVGLTCSVGVGYSMMSAKIASEEKKPDGFFEILTPTDLRDLIIDRNVRVIYGVGPSTAKNLQRIGVSKVRDITVNPQGVIDLLGTYGQHIVDLANGIDERNVTVYSEEKSIGRERTFQQDVTDLGYLKYILILIAKKLSNKISKKGIYAKTITLKITYGDMQSITRSKTGDATNQMIEIYQRATVLFESIEKRPIRLIGISVSGFTPHFQMSLFDNDKGICEEVAEVIKKYGSRYKEDAEILHL
jgi:DNA polymerase-4/DNA polymerase IV (DinB-like DNA polymerase)